MTRTLYDLAAADPACRFSPHCWRVRLALAAKGLDYETRPWRFSEKETIAFAGTDKVPVLVDGDATVADSWAILHYLEDRYPDTPSVFGCADARRQAGFFRAWCELVVQAGLAPMIVADIHARLHADDQEYFRRSREQRLGDTLERLHAARGERLPGWRSGLEPMRRALADQPFLGGDAPLVPDLLVYAALLWVRHASTLEAVAPDDPIAAWRERMDTAFAGA